MRMDDELIVFNSMRGLKPRILFLTQVLSDSNLTRVITKHPLEDLVVNHRLAPRYNLLNDEFFQRCLKWKHYTLLGFLQSRRFETLSNESVNMMMKLLSSIAPDMNDWGQFYYELRDILNDFLLNNKELRDVIYNNKYMKKCIDKWTLSLVLLGDVPLYLQEAYMEGEISVKHQSKFNLERKFQIQELKKQKDDMYENLSDDNSYLAYTRMYKVIQKSLDMYINSVFDQKTSNYVGTAVADEDDYNKFVEKSYKDKCFDDEVYDILRLADGNTVLRNI